MLQTKYAMMINCLGGNELSCWTENENGDDVPVLFDTEVDAWKEIADDMVTELNQFINGERELEHTNFSTEFYVQEVWVTATGEIIEKNEGDTEDSILSNTVLFDPKIGRP